MRLDALDAAALEALFAAMRAEAEAVVRPATTAELSEVVRLCAALGVPMVPQGGNTSMVGGAAPSAAGRQVVVSLGRMNRVRHLDPLDLTLTVEAGVSWRTAQDAAAAFTNLF